MEEKLIVPDIDVILNDLFVMLNEYNFKKVYPDFHRYLVDNYPDDITFVEKLYWYYHGISSYPLCECGNRVRLKSFIKGYNSFCGYKCARNSEITKQKLRQTNIDRYGVEYNSQADGPKQKMMATTIKRYGYACSLHNPIISEKVRQTKLERYGNPTFTNPKKMQQTKLEKYGNPTFTNPSKGYTTRKLNNSYNSSSIELNLKKWLEDHSVNFEYQYKCELYPFYCDFYFPDKKLFLEIQGNWTHGFHPYNPGNSKDLEIASIWRNKGTKYYNTALEVWTIKDPIKRRMAKENGLNWIEIFSIKLPDVLNLLADNGILNKTDIL